MLKINFNDVPQEERSSPKGRFRMRRRHITDELLKDGQQRPFDLEMVVIPPGAANFPYHSHTAAWEMYVIISGQGIFRSPEGETPITAGDSILCPPGDPHQIRNDSTQDLTYYVIADNVPLEVCNYHDSQKTFIMPPPEVEWFKLVEYWGGEE